MDNTNTKEILRVLVGSRACGLESPDSDYDYRAIHIKPTSTIVSLGHKYKASHSINGVVDDLSYELYHFLKLAAHSNSDALQCLVAPVISNTPEGILLQELFPKLWSSDGVLDAYEGYARSQYKNLKKIWNSNKVRAAKFAVSYIRVLYYGTQLLIHGTYDLNVRNTELWGMLWRWKNKLDLSLDEVEFVAEEWTRNLHNAYAMNHDKETDYEAVNNFLINIRKNNWEI